LRLYPPNTKPAVRYPLRAKLNVGDGIYMAKQPPHPGSIPK
jgi:hypothetical protein